MASEPESCFLGRTGQAITGSPIPAGSSSQPFSASFGGDALLYLVDTAGHATGTGADRGGFRCEIGERSAMPIQAARYNLVV